MPTECSAELFEFAPVAGRRVVASFDGGAITSDAGGLLLGQADAAVRLTDRFAACFNDRRNSDLIEHQVITMAMQRVVGIAVGYEDLNDHDELRHDPVLAGKLEARRADCAPLAGKSTLNRLELSRSEPTRYHKVSHDAAAIEALLVDIFLEAHSKAPRQITLDLDATDDPPSGEQEGRFFHGYGACPRVGEAGPGGLLPSSLRVLRPAYADSEVAALEHRRLCRRGGGDRPYRDADPASLAACAHSAARLRPSWRLRWTTVAGPASRRGASRTSATRPWTVGAASVA